MKFRELFSDNPINTGRQFEVDIGKAIPVLCLPFVHCFIECTSLEGLNHGVPFLFDYVIGARRADKPLRRKVFVYDNHTDMITHYIK